MVVYKPDHLLTSSLKLTELTDSDEIAIMSVSECIVASSGFQTFLRHDFSEMGRIPPPVSTSDGQCKAFADLLEALVLRQSLETIPEGLTPENRRKAIDSILNDPSVRHRFIFSNWPRPKEVPGWKEMNPQPYNIITPESSLPGKMAPNGLELWGATLLDFFTVERIPGLAKLRTFSTGSKLLRWCKENGEYEGKNAVAKECIAWAERERDPELIPVYNVANLIRGIEDSAFAENSVSRVKDDHDEGKREPITENTEAKKTSIRPFAREWPPNSIFDPSTYPEPWTDTVPFSKSGPWSFGTLPVLEEYIPHSRLPKKLIVHDPWDVLCANGRSHSGFGWNEQVHKNPDCVHTYYLSPSDGTRRRQEEEEDVVRGETDRKGILNNFLANPHSSTARPFGLEISNSYNGPINGSTKPVIYVLLPPRPPLAAASEAHLYLSPNKRIGEGNHSYVYNAEWELPRSCLVEERLCIDCVVEDLEAILREQDGANGKKRNKKWDELSGKMVLKGSAIDDFVVTTEGGSKEMNSHIYVHEGGKASKEVVYEGPYRVIHSRVKYQNLGRAPYCNHLQGQHNRPCHPLTAKVQVTAKLSHH